MRVAARREHGRLAVERRRSCGGAAVSIRMASVVAVGAQPAEAAGGVPLLIERQMQHLVVVVVVVVVEAELAAAAAAAAAATAAAAAAAAVARTAVEVRRCAVGWRAASWSAARWSIASSASRSRASSPFARAR